MPARPAPSYRIKNSTCTTLVRNYLRTMPQPPRAARSRAVRSLVIPAPVRRRAARSVGVVVGHLVMLCALIASPRDARAQDESAEAIQAITKLNKSALEEYDNLSFDVARRLLNEALDLCAKNGLDRHPIKARTLVHVGVVTLAGGPSQHDEAVKYFREALAIQREIKLSDRMANPEVQAAFDEAAAAMKDTEPPPPSPVASPSPTPATPQEPIVPAPATAGLSHDAIASAPKGSAIPVSVTTDPALGAKKVVLSYRPDGDSEFISRELKEYSAGNWSGSIPASATDGDEISYALAVENQSGEVVATQGSQEAPMLIALKAVRAVAIRKAPPGDEPPSPEPVRESPTWFLGLGVGSGFGWATGNGDVNTDDKVTSGFGSSRLGHVVPEIGYFVSPDLLVSLQVRLQLVSGASSVRDLSDTMCGPDHVCDPATGALAAFGRITWLFGDSLFVPYLSFSLGAGQIRHLASFPASVGCGGDAAHPVKCVDTVAAGPILVGPGGGFIVNVASGFGFTAGVSTLLGFPQFTFHVDFNAGVVLEI